MEQQSCKRVPQIVVCSFVVSLLILSTTKAHTRLRPFHQIFTKDLIHTWLSYTTKSKTLLKNSLSNRWKSCEFLRYLVADFQLRPECGRELCLKGEYVTVSIKSGIGPNEFLFMHGFVFWARVGGGRLVTQLPLRVLTCVQLNSPLLSV